MGELHPSKEKQIKQVQTYQQPKKEGPQLPLDPLDLLLSDPEEGVKRVEVKDQGSSAKSVKVIVPGVPELLIVERTYPL